MFVRKNDENWLLVFTAFYTPYGGAAMEIILLNPIGERYIKQLPMTRFPPSDQISERSRILFPKSLRCVSRWQYGPSPEL
jgi:hypothetical protein